MSSEQNPNFNNTQISNCFLTLDAIKYTQFTITTNDVKY